MILYSGLLLCGPYTEQLGCEGGLEIIWWYWRVYPILWSVNIKISISSEPIVGLGNLRLTMSAYSLCVFYEFFLKFGSRFARPVCLHPECGGS